MAPALHPGTSPGHGPDSDSGPGLISSLPSVYIFTSSTLCILIGLSKRGTCGQGYLGFAKMYLELLELLLELLLQMLLELLLELLLLLLLFSLPRTW